MNSTEKQIDQAMKRLDSDPALAADFDNLRRTEYPGKSRREACELGLKAITAKNEATLAAVRAKALKYSAAAAVTTFKKAVADMATTTAEKFRTPQVSMQLAEFNKLNPADKMRYVKSGGKLQ